MTSVIITALRVISIAIDAIVIVVIVRFLKRMNNNKK